jgi:hypothetical protein
MTKTPPRPDSSSSGRRDATPNQVSILEEKANLAARSGACSTQTHPRTDSSSSSSSGRRDATPNPLSILEEKANLAARSTARGGISARPAPQTDGADDVVSSAATPFDPKQKQQEGDGRGRPGAIPAGGPRFPSSASFSSSSASLHNNNNNDTDAEDASAPLLLEATLVEAGKQQVSERVLEQIEKEARTKILKHAVEAQVVAIQDDDDDE